MNNSRSLLTQSTAPTSNAQTEYTATSRPWLPKLSSTNQDVSAQLERAADKNATPVARWLQESAREAPWHIVGSYIASAERGMKDSQADEKRAENAGGSSVQGENGSVDEPR